jgi:enoyl-[acyl-carrier-protein] reductase (NADH)
VAEIRKKIRAAQHIKVMLHSLAFGSLKLFIDKDASKCIAPDNVAMTMNVLAHSLIYWHKSCFGKTCSAMDPEYFAMTSHDSHTVLPIYGAVSAAKAALEAHIRQLLSNLSNRCDNAMPSNRVTNTPALQKIPGYEAMIEATLRRNPADG